MGCELVSERLPNLPGSLYFGKPGALQHQAGCLSQAIGLWALAPLLHKEA